MKTIVGRVDMTLLVYQPVPDWIEHVKAKYGAARASACKKIIGAGWEEKTVDALDKSPREILKLAKSLR